MLCERSPLTKENIILESTDEVLEQAKLIYGIKNKQTNTIMVAYREMKVINWDGA